MQTIDTHAILVAALNFVFIYLIAAMLAVDGWVLYRLLTGRPVFPPSPLLPRQSVPWGAWTVLLIFVLNLVMPQCVFEAYALEQGLLAKRSPAAPAATKAQAPPHVSNEKQMPQGRPLESDAKSVDVHLAPQNPQRATKSNPSQPRPTKPPAKPSDELSATSELPFSLTELLSLQAVSSIFLLVLAPLLLRLTSRSPFRDLGLSFNRWWLQAGIGFVAFLAIQPALMATQVAMTKIWESHPHPLLKMVANEFSPGVPQLAILLAVVVAPIAEELVYRGVIQSWLVSQCQRRPKKPPRVPSENPAHPAGTHVATPESIESSSQPAKFQPDVAAPIEPSLQADEPPATNAPLAPRGAALVGITMTSLIFAALHFQQWPAPIALFLLSIVIGYVYERTRSLIAAICMHAAFNGFSTFLMLSSLLVPQSAQHSEAEKVKQPAAVAEISNTRDCACIQFGKPETAQGIL